VEYTKLGRSGLSVSRLTFGAMTFGVQDFHGFRTDLDQQAADAMIGAALDAGVNVMDTADMYAGGQSEEILGRALASSGRRDRVVVATKVASPMSDDPNDAGLSYRHVINGCEASLRRLGTDWIDLYQLHAADFTTPLDETLRALDDLVRRGLVRYVGWSNWPAWMAAEAQQLQRGGGLAPFVSAQVHYSLLSRDLESDILPYARHAGLGTLIWSPLAGGFLAGKYTREDPGGGGGRLASFTFPPIDRERGYDVVDRLKAIAGDLGATPAQVALAWLLGRDGVTSVIVGATRMEQLADNLAAAELRLGDAERAALDELTAPTLTYPHWMYAGGW
jgi:aryl-alcohol dehydrogenase-like predicted oxidoreductase